MFSSRYNLRLHPADSSTAFSTLQNFRGQRKICFNIFWYNYGWIIKPVAKRLEIISPYILFPENNEMVNMIIVAEQPDDSHMLIDTKTERSDEKPHGH